MRESSVLFHANLGNGSNRVPMMTTVSGNLSAYNGKSEMWKALGGKNSYTSSTGTSNMSSANNGNANSPKILSNVKNSQVYPKFLKKDSILNVGK